MLVGVTGIITSLGILAIAVIANVCYTGGWITELIVRRTWPQESREIGTLSFTLGLILSVGVTLLPISLDGGLIVLVALFAN